MTQDDENKFKSLLERQRLDLEDKLREEGRTLPVSSDDPGDEVDLSNDYLLNKTLLQLRRRRCVALEKIRAALERINRGTFGKCIDCGWEIEVTRLKALPTTLRCIACQESTEDHLHFCA